MRLFIVIILLVLVASFAYAEDTSLGKINLTKNQVNHLSKITGSLNGIVKGCSYWEDGETIIVSTQKLTEENKIDLVNRIKELPDTEIPKEKSAIEKRIETLEKKVTDLEKK